MKAVSSNLSFINKKAIKSVFFGVFTGSLIITVMMIISTIIFLQSGKLPSDILDYIILVFLGVGSLIGGYISGRIYKSSGIIIGAITGIIMFLIILIAGLSDFSGSISVITLYKLLATVIPSILGAILGVNKKEKIKLK